MDIKVHVNKMASALKSQQNASIKSVQVLKAFINEASLGDALIQNYIDQVQEQAIAKGVLKSSSATMKSQIKKVLTLAKDHKDEVMKKAEQAGNLDQWYKACLAGNEPTRNKSHKVNKPKVEELPKLGEEDKKPSGERDFVTEFKTVAQEMMSCGMTAEQLHAMIEELTAAKAA